MTNPSTEQRELALVEKVDFRILGVSNNEEKLQQLLKTYLPPLLLKAGSEYAAVRNKVIAICQRLNIFIKPPGVVLPVATLLDQYKANNSPLIKHFDLVFVQHSVGRLGLRERRELIPKAIRGIGTDTGSGTAGLFNVLLQLLPDLRIPPRGDKEDGTFREDVGLGDAADAKFVAEWLGKLQLLRPASARPEMSPGLTDSDIAFLTLSKPDTWNPANGGLSLPEIRIKAVSFLASGAFTDEERFLPAVYAAAHSDSRVASIGDDMLKRSNVSLEDKSLVASLFEAHGLLPAPYRIRILGLLSKSEVASTFGEDILEVFGQNVIQAPDSEAPERPGGIGLEASKVHKALFEFINWVARVGSKKEGFTQTGSPLINSLRDFILSQGWPKPTRQSHDDIARRSQAYETIGTIAKSITMSSPQALSLLGWLFRSLAEDPIQDVVVNIDGALSGFTSAFKGRNRDTATTNLTAILLTYMTMKIEGDVVRSARHAVTKWANIALPFSDVNARWIDILAVAGRRDERNEVVEEGHKGLDPWTYYANSDRSRDLPAWNDMVQKFFKEQISHMNTAQWLAGRGMDVDERSVFTNFAGEGAMAFPVAVEYCKRILFLTALKDFALEPGWERQLEALIQSDKPTRETIRAYLVSEEGHGEELRTLLTAAFEGMILENNIIVEKCSRTFVELASFSPMVSLEHLASRSRELLPLVKSNKREIRALGARAYGILAAHPTNSNESIVHSKDTLINITKALKTAIGSELNAVEGAFVALAHFLSRLVYYSKSTNSEISANLGEVFPTLDSVSSSTLSVQEALFEAFTQLWTAGISGFSIPPDQAAGIAFVEKAFIDPLTVQAKKGNEKAITALGRLAMVYPNDTEGQEADAVGAILTKLYELYEIKQAETHFAVGEAITAATACWDANVVQLVLDVQSDDTTYRTSKRSARISEVLEKLLKDCKSTKPSLLKASGIWLFCIIQHCSHLEEVQRKLRECQVAFMRLLSARDELVQETASRGLALAYEKGDPSLKDDLVRDLVASFTGSGPQLKVDDETELFDAGALPTGGGKSITSYKDIVSLANEVGDQSLVYKFMSLANNAATWSTRSAFGRFGLSSILSESEIDPKLYPKLFRYRFDPNQNVQKSMDDIWKALVKDSNAVLETHFDAIMTDLLKSVLGKEWRVREASCAAISDLIQGRQFKKYEPYYKDVWTAALKVLDDVKATVRAAALRLCITLSNTLVRQLEESASPVSAKAMMSEALPFLLSDKGIESGVEDVKVFATITVMKISKSGGKALKPFIATMIPHLLGLLSTIEPDAINYHYLRAGEDSREKIDKLRSAMVSQSPISEAIENCLRSVDSTVMVDLAPGLEGTIKSAVGMPTKIGCGRVLGTLATRHAADFKPYAARFLQLVEKQALDRNDEVSQGYARAAAYILRAAPDEARIRFAEQFINLYLRSEDESRRQKVADAVLALSKISPDHFSALEGMLLPLAFLAKHDTDEYVQKAAEEVWSKHAGSSLSVTRYIPEIVSLVQKSLDTAQWALKHAGALTTASLVGAVTGASDLSGQVNVDNLKAIWPVFDKSLALKTFADKQKLLEVFPDFVSKGKALWAGNAQFGDQLKKIATREAKRNNDAYRPHAFRCLWRFAAAREDLDMLEDIYAIVSDHLDETEDEEAMDVDKPERGSGVGGMDLSSKTTWAAVEAIAKGYNRANMRSDPFAELGRIVGTLEQKTSLGAAIADPLIGKPRFDIIRRVHWYGCVVDVMDEAAKCEKASMVKLPVLRWFLATLDLSKSDHGTEDQRLARAKAVAAVVQLWKKQGALSGSSWSGDENRGLVDELRGQIESAGRIERSMEVQEKWRSCLGLLE